VTISQNIIRPLFFATTTTLYKNWIFKDYLDKTRQDVMS